MMKTEIHHIRLGLCTCHLIRQEGLILVDAGSPNRGRTFLRALDNLSIDPRDISLIFITHGHYDHIGSARAIKELTGARLAINHREKEWVERPLKPTPPGITVWGKLIMAVIKLGTPLIRFPGAHVDLALGDDEFSLEGYGIHGKILHTPGHTAGSMSLLLNTGEAFVGDLAMSGLPRLRGCGMPVVGNDANTIKQSWRKILGAGAKWIHPGHGEAFRAEILEDLL